MWCVLLREPGQTDARRSHAVTCHHVTHTTHTPRGVIPRSLNPFNNGYAIFLNILNEMCIGVILTLITANSEAHKNGALVTSSDVRNMLLPDQSISRFAAIWFNLRPIELGMFAILFSAQLSNR